MIAKRCELRFFFKSFLSRCEPRVRQTPCLIEFPATLGIYVDGCLGLWESLPTDVSLVPPSSPPPSTSCLSLHLSPCLMPPTFHQPPPESPPSPAIDTINLSPTPGNGSTPPPISGDLQTTIPIYQLNSPTANNLWAPYGQGPGLPQNYAPVQFGVGGLGEYVTFFPIITPH